MTPLPPPRSDKRAPLTVAHLTKIYRNRSAAPVIAVSDISFEVPAGECFGLLGPNGAGKTTTIRCICGLYPASSGNVFINANNVYTHPKQARQQLGVCSQDETLDSDFTVFDQLVMYARYFGISRAIAKTRAKQLLDQFNIAEKTHEPVESLSGGMRRRLQVARALISEPKVLVLDEPTTGLDPEVRRTLWEILMQVRKQGTAILLSTHYMEEAGRLCDRVAILHKGKILDIDSPEALIKKHIARTIVEEEVRPGVIWKRPPNLEDVYLKLTGSRLGVEGL